MRLFAPSPFLPPFLSLWEEEKVFDVESDFKPIIKWT